MPNLTPEQKTQIAQWLAEGDNLSVLQKKLSSTYNLNLTYMDVRFLVDDLNLTLKDPPQKQPPPEAPPAPPPETQLPEDHSSAPAGTSTPADADTPENTAPSTLSLTVDPVSLNPMHMASGSVRFSDGVTAKWFVDQQGRPGLTAPSQPNYRPTPADAESFMTQLSAALQEKGF